MKERKKLIWGKMFSENFLKSPPYKHGAWRMYYIHPCLKEKGRLNEI